MTPRHRTTFFWSWCFLLLSISLSNAQNQPTVSKSYFENFAGRLFFFEDTTTVVNHDVIARNVHISHDEGKSWTRADIPEGQAGMILEHPFDNKCAFILSQGTTHYRTLDRGKSWQSFTMPIAPSYVSRPLSFHSDPKKFGYILYQGTKCDGSGWGARCHDETWYTKNAFGDDPSLLMEDTNHCLFAHSSKDFKHEAPEDLIYCVAFDTSSSTGSHALSSSRLFSSSDFFKDNKKVEDLGIGKNARGVVAIAIVSKFAIVALKNLGEGSEGEMFLYVTVDTKSWARARFPHASSARLRENAYTIVESTTHSLAVDVLLQDQSAIGTLFVSNSNGTYFVQSLKDTNRNNMGFVDYENIYGVEGVGLANMVDNAREAESRHVPKHLKTKITFDDGRSWTDVKAPSTDYDGNKVKCNTADSNICSLHLHSVTIPHNFGRIFSSPAPGLVMGVGSIGEYLRPYEESDTFLSTDAGVSWRMVRFNAHKYEFGDSGSILVVVNDEEPTDQVSYSNDFGKSWNSFNFGVKLWARTLTTVSDSTSQKFILLGQLAKADQPDSQSRFVTIFLDFEPLRTRQCEDDDFETWYARTSKNSECLMGHKQWYRRRKQNANCYVGRKFEDPVEHEDNCQCGDDDYECDYNYVRDGDKCVAVGPEPLPADSCATGDASETYFGSSGYRRIPGNTCQGGLKKDERVEKPCSQAQPAEGEVTHQIFEFPWPIVQQAYFDKSTTILVLLANHSLWQSVNEGYSWSQIRPGETFVVFYHHKYSNDRAYAITATDKVYYTTDTGRGWFEQKAPLPPNSFSQPILHFHPHSENLIWTGDKGCEGSGDNCHAEAFYSTDNGRKWQLIDTYVRNCAWAKDASLFANPTEIICESYRDKAGAQRAFQLENPLQLIAGTNYYKDKTKLFDHVVGFAKFSEYLIVAEYQEAKQSLDLQVSLDGLKFATGLFPPSTNPVQHAYTILESSTKSVFLHVTLSEPPSPYWGSILKSNSNGTYFGLSAKYVNRDDHGYVDFEKMIGLDGIALINVVSNPELAAITRNKLLQTRITHNDGGTWKPLIPPPEDSLGRKYECESTKCALHVHGYTERYDARATFSTPSVPGLLMAVGNVGEHLAPYTESDTFLSRDGGFTWQEVHKDAHLWEFGDSGSILVMVNDEAATDHVLFSTDEGLNWREYKFTSEKMRIRSIVTVPSDTSRRFILLGAYLGQYSNIAVHIDFSSLTRKKCVLDVEDPGKDDFELWSPSEEREERCLFGRQTLYHRRVRDRNCVVGDQPKAEERIVKNCVCMESDFECEFNYERDETGRCVLVKGLQPLPNDESCRDDEDYWYERTAYRRIPYSSCVGEGSMRIDRGKAHVCPGFKAHGALFWWTIVMIPFAFTALVAYWYYRRSGLARGTIRLPGEPSSRYSYGNESGVMSTLASVPWFLIGVAGIAWESVSSTLESFMLNYRTRSGYRDVAVDEDAQILRFEDED